jgi:predicted ATPase
MITHVQIKNFKAWRDTRPMPLKPLTVLFGTNSSGKSSIEQFFLMLRQTAESSDRRLVLHAGDRKSAVNLGSFEELVHRRDKTAKLEFSFEWELPGQLEVEDPKTSQKWSGDRMAFECSLGLQNGRLSQLGVNHFSYHLRRGGNDVLTVKLEGSEGGKTQYKLSSTPYDLVRVTGRPWQLGPPSRFYGFPEQVSAYYQNADFVQDFSLALEQMLKSVCYLGPLRSRGERLYSWTGGEPANVGFAGEHSVSALLAAKERQINTGFKKRTRPFQKLIAEQLEQLGIIDAFEVRQISANRKEYEVKIKTPGAPDWVDLPDVGFGVSQVLPVVVQSFYAPTGSILFIEQPELHLHPGAQANLADLFIDVLNAHEAGQPRRVQLIIETHSEHFLNRLQRRIAEASPANLIRAEDVACYYARATRTESVLAPLEVDMFGNIQNWPPNFFGDSMGDLMEMQRAAAERRMGPTKPQSPST